MKRFLCILLCMVAMNAFADIVTFSSARNVRVGSKIVQVGDPASQVRKASEPDKITPVINDFGAKVGEQWLYDRGNGSYTVIMVNNAGWVYAVGDFIDR